MRAHPLACLALLLLLPATTAAADTTIATSEEAKPKPPTRKELRIGTLLGGADIGDVEGFSGGLHLALGYRRGDLGIIGELQSVSVGDDVYDLPADQQGSRRHGRSTRGALMARLNVLSGSPDGPISGDLWLEGGVGYEHVSWHPGGVLDRPFAAFTVGGELDARPGKGPRPRHVGPYVGIRTQLARDPDRGEMVTCGGPCSRATRPSPLDVSIYAVFGVHTGR
jgi:hypothetical protein